MRRPLRWPDWLEDVWAKSAEKGAGGSPESLAQHTWLVLERFSDLARLRPTLPQTIGVPRLWHILFWAIMIHDFGKAACGFQARLRGGPRWPYRHEVLSLAFIDWIAGAFTGEEVPWVVAAVVSHHRDAEEIQNAYEPLEDPYEEDIVATLIAELPDESIRGMLRWLTECSEDWICSLGLDQLGVRPAPLPEVEQAVQQIRKKGAARVHDWLKVYRRFLKAIDQSNEPVLIIGTLALRGHIINADQSASAHVRSSPKADFSAKTVLERCDLDPRMLFRHQQLAGETLGSALLIAPTGSGKTEAAQLWAARQATDTPITRLFYTLPYQASMNAMQRRLAQSYGEAQVGILHGRALSALYRMMLEKEYDPRQAAKEARWARNLAQLNHQPVRVFSPFQMLKGMYRLKGYEALLLDYHGAAFIFDEIHAYEVRRLAMILKTIEYLTRNYSARFLIMSATFPNLIRRQLQSALNSPAEILTDEAVFVTFRRHRLHLLDGELTDEENLQRICADARKGKSVLVVCNLVARAQDMYERLRQRLANQRIEVVLLHSRFTIRDRLHKETQIRHAVGSKSSQRKPVVLVATQAVEVSLDIDLDTLYSDPAPLEALVQRFGRINRRRLHPDLAPVHVFCRPDDGQKIYAADIVKRTIDILKREDGRPIDESSIGSWLDEIYAGEIAEQWQNEYARAASEFEATCIRTLRAFQSDLMLQEEFYKAFDGLEVLPNDLYDEYARLYEDDPIRAHDLLVPISWRSYHALARQGMVKAGDRRTPPVVLTSYTAEQGLMFDSFSGTEQ
ncbi:CRISPR-associated helicase Cas3' [Caldilinea sp.]|uniref:CRISPR-associated helicase Cas3' n=1 Tax=Caldilinea sp. TaxID=2293560 RepID=UPI0021DC60B5|nr:CRISPR-associated helicase Cas3' [Caldilinea sp.]GIV67762.1 MAG: CRISPR-associated helicase/endonuclease Cas3 [Caldilinea sp.]GIV71275.1 MAG: CRISPR-associated helicase/endonuclease Cas3 [Caldilinea sp.]